MTGSGGRKTEDTDKRNEGGGRKPDRGVRGKTVGQRKINNQGEIRTLKKILKGKCNKVAHRDFFQPIFLLSLKR